MKHLKTLFALAFFGLTALAPLAAHSQAQPASKMEPQKVESQNETRLLSEQEMQSITGAGKACNTSGEPCTSECIPKPTQKEKMAPRTYWNCGPTLLPTTCSESSRLCGEWRGYNYSFKGCFGKGTYISSVSTQGCDGAPYTPGTPAPEEK